MGPERSVSYYFMIKHCIGLRTYRDVNLPTCPSKVSGRLGDPDGISPASCSRMRCWELELPGSLDPGGRLTLVVVYLSAFLLSSSISASVAAWLLTSQS
jgi:hypothetical protein